MSILHGTFHILLMQTTLIETIIKPILQIKTKHNMKAGGGVVNELPSVTWSVCRRAKTSLYPGGASPGPAFLPTVPLAWFPHQAITKDVWAQCREKYSTADTRTLCTRICFNLSFWSLASFPKVLIFHINSCNYKLCVTVFGYYCNLSL